MSVKLNYNTLPDNYKTYIYNNLIIKSKSSYKTKFTKKYKSNDDDNKDTDSVLTCYNHNITDNSISIPFNISLQLFKQNINNNNTYPNFIFNNNITLYDYQLEIYNTAIEHLNNFNTTTLYIYTGSGKTRLCVCLTANMGYNTIILVSNIDIAQQWVNNYNKLTNMKTYLVEANKTIPENTNVIVCMDGRIQHISQDIINKCGVLVVDEAHTFCTNLRIQAILKIQPKYIIMATATLNRQDGLHKALHMIVGEHNIYRKSTKKFTVYKYHTGINVPIKYTYKKEPDFNALVNDLCFNVERNKIILKLIMDNPTFKILVMTRRVDHVKILYNVLKNNGQNVECMYGNKKKYTESRILIASVSKIGTGFDEESRCSDFSGININMLILVSTIKDVSLFEQVCGRVFRSQYPYIVHLVDDVDIIKYSHWNIAKKWYISRNGIIENIYSDYYIQHKKDIEIVKNIEVDQTISDSDISYILSKS